MHFRVAGRLVALAVVVMSASVRAQPLDTLGAPVRPDERPSNGSTNMPVSMSEDTEMLSAEAIGNAARPRTVALDAPIDPDRYICGPGDVFELNFWGQQNFRLRISVDVEGRMFISKVGFLDVGEKTLTAVRADVKKKVRGTYPGLKADLTLTSPRTFTIHVAENVKKPGAYQASPLERVSAIIERAGGSTGSRRRIEIKRRNGTKLTADLVAYALTGNIEHNPYVLDGDIITVPFAEVQVNITGAVRRPGSYELVKSKDLAELLELAGGLSRSATRTLPIQLVRRNKREHDAVTNLAFAADGSAPNTRLRDDDRLVVRGVEDLQRSVLLLGAIVGSETVDAATTSKRLPFVEGDTVLSLLDRAGGIRAPGDLKRAYISRASKAGAQEIIPIDLEALLVRRDLEADRPIRMNDTIVIPPMRYSIRVEGAVARPGLYTYNPLFGIPEYIAHAGGRTRSARDLDEVKLIDPNGTTQSFNNKLKPSPGDAILVPERNFSRAEVVQIVLAGAGLVLSGAAIAFAATR